MAKRVVLIPTVMLLALCLVSATLGAVRASASPALQTGLISLAPGQGLALAASSSGPMSLLAVERLPVGRVDELPGAASLPVGSFPPPASPPGQGGAHDLLLSWRLSGLFAGRGFQGDSSLKERWLSRAGGFSAPADSLPTYPAAPFAAAPGGQVQAFALLAPPLPAAAGQALCQTTSRLWGTGAPRQTVTVLVDGTQSGAAVGEKNGFFWTTLYNAAGERQPLEAGSTVVVNKDGLQAASATLRAINASIDVYNDTVSGSLGGSGFPINVTIYTGQLEPALNAYSQTVSTDAAGHFTASFAGIIDLLPWSDAQVAYLDGDVEIHQHVYPTTSMAVSPSPVNLVQGSAPAGATVTVSVQLTDTTVVYSTTLQAGAPSGYFEASLPVEVVPGYTVVMQAGGDTRSRRIDLMNLITDPANDRLTGIAPAGALARGLASDLSTAGWRDVSRSSVVDASGLFTISYAGLVNIMPGHFAAVMVADADGDDQGISSPSPWLQVDQTWDNVSGRAGPIPGPYMMGETVTLTVYSAAAGATSQYTQVLTGASGRFFFWKDDYGLPDLAPGDLITAETLGGAWQTAVTLQPMAAQPDLPANQFTGQVTLPSTRVELWANNPMGSLYPLAGTVWSLGQADGAGSFTTASPGFDLHGNLEYSVSHRDAQDNLEIVSGHTDYFGVMLPGNAVVGNLAPAGTSFTLTLQDSLGGFKAQLNGVSAAPAGDLGWLDFNPTGQQIQPGDQLLLQGDNGYNQVLGVPDIQINVDPNSGLLSGQAPANSLLMVDAAANKQQVFGFVPSRADGSYAVLAEQLQQAQPGFLPEWGEPVGVRYTDPDHNFVLNQFLWPAIVPWHNMDGDSRVQGYDATPGSTVLITVSHPLSGVLASGSTVVGGCSGCAPSEYNLDLLPGQLPPGSLVTANFGGGLVDSDPVLPVAAQADPAADQVTVSGPPGQAVRVFADGPSGTWGSKDRYPEAVFAPDGTFTFDTAPDGYDIVPGTNFTVRLPQLHGHANVYRFWLPILELGVWKWNPPGGARPGGVVVYNLRYRNNGNGVAQNVMLTDQLPIYTSYAGDTSGLPYVQAPGFITWTLGDVPPQTERTFMLSLNVDPSTPVGPAVLPGNLVTITLSESDPDPGNNWAISGPTDVWDEDIDLRLGKNVSPQDPAPGQVFQYGLNWCNQRGTAAGPAWLTDTLPVSSTLLSWQVNDQNYPLWTEVLTTGGKLVLRAPGLPGNMCGDVIVFLRLDPAARRGLLLTNSAVLDTAGDVNPYDNRAIDQNARAGLPRPDVAIEKWRHNAILTPGGGVLYHIGVWNEGNTAVHAWVTDTLPAHSSYQAGSERYPDGRPFSPARIIGNQVVWDIGLVPGFGRVDFDFTLNISPTHPIQAPLTNCAVAALDVPEGNLSNNQACLTDWVSGHGPNLVVRKSHSWTQRAQLSYRVDFENVGDQPVVTPWLTDTLPAATTRGYQWQLGFDPSRLISQSLSDGQIVLGFQALNPGDIGFFDFNASLDDPDFYPRVFTNTVQIAPTAGDVDPLNNSYRDPAVYAEVRQVELHVTAADRNVWGQAQPNVPITLTTAHRQVTGWADWAGNFNLNNAGPIAPGDRLTLTAGAGIMPVVINVPFPFNITVDSAAGRITGLIGGAGSQWIMVQPHWPAGGVNVQLAAGGFSVAYPDIPRGGSGHVSYNQAVGGTTVIFRRDFSPPELVLRVNYAHRWVDALYDLGHTLWLTATDSAGSFKAAASAQSRWIHGDYDTGFMVEGSQFVPSEFTLQPGDWVYGLLDNGQQAQVQVGTINGLVSAAQERVTGSVSVPWYSQWLEGRCEIWAPTNTQPFRFDVAPGGGPYLCDFALAGADLPAGVDTAVIYSQPDSNEVINIFQQPAPHLGIDQGFEGYPGEGGNFVIHVNYRNDGTAPALDTTVTATLEGMSYLADTSGVGHAGGGGGPIVWKLGSLAPQSSAQFNLYARVEALEGETVTGTVEIATSDPYDQGGPWEKFSQWTRQVGSNDTHLEVNKGAWTMNPAPGTSYVYNINACNNGGSGSSTVTLTDTLPASTTLQSWWASDPGWQLLASSPGQLAVTIPSLSGWSSCSQVFAKVQLAPAAWPGMPLQNRAEITSTNDLEENDNVFILDHNVGEPYTNLRVGKNWNWGTLNAGGEIRYSIDYANNGSLPVSGTIRITDTLPVSTTFIQAWKHTPSGSFVYTPTQVIGNQLVWVINGLENGYSDNFEVALRISSQAAPGTALTNCAEIGAGVVEWDERDNRQCVTEKIFPVGPNLRVTKFAEWRDQNSLQYRIRVENIGATTVPQVAITDVYPAGYALWGWWLNVPSSGTSGPANPFTITLQDPLQPGQGAWLNMNIGTPPLANGELVTNTAQVTLPPGDVNPADNTSSLVMGAGPDLAIDKTLSGGTPIPGELLTYTLYFRNQSQAWGTTGNGWITDTLPAEVTLVGAKIRFCGPTLWCDRPPDVSSGSQVAWNQSGFPPGAWNELLVTVQLSGSLHTGDLLSNQADIASDDPQDVDPFPANNHARLDLFMWGPQFAIGKEFGSSRVAGLPVTYTLWVTNSGRLPAHGVLITDRLPLGLVYLQGGSYNPATQIVSWTLPLLGEGSSQAVQFAATLPCTASQVVVNDRYQVVGSQEGPPSPPGPAVSLNVLPPVIQAVAQQSAASLVVGRTFYFTSTSTSSGLPLSHAWDFGDGSSAVGPTANHAFTKDGPHTVRLVVQDGCDFTQAAAITVTALAPAITASFEASAASVAVGRMVYFTDTSTTNGPALATRLWDFGDRQSASGLSASHYYTQTGTFDVTLWVADAYGYHSQVVHQVQVITPTIQAAFQASVQHALAGATVYFTDTSTTNGAMIAAWEWNFGDQSTPAFTPSASHVYTTAGVYPVALKVTDKYGFSAAASLPVTVTSTCTPLSAVGLTFTPSQPYPGASVTFTATLTPADATQPISYTWNFGEGAPVSGSAAVVQYRYTQAKTYQVQVTAANPCSTRQSQKVAVPVQRYQLYLPFAARGD